MEFVERERLFGLGYGLVDMLLLASTKMTPGVEFLSVEFDSDGTRIQPIDNVFVHQASNWSSHPLAEVARACRQARLG